MMRGLETLLATFKKARSETKSPITILRRWLLLYIVEVGQGERELPESQVSL